MSAYAIELLDAQQRRLAGPVDILALAAPFLRRLPGVGLPGAQIALILLPVPGVDNDLTGETWLRYASPEIGYAQVVVRHAEQVVYRHPHTLGEVLEEGVRRWAAQINPPPAAYRLTGLTLIGQSGFAPPAVEGVTEIKPYAQGEQPAFRIRPLPPPEPEPRRLDDFGAAPLPAAWLGPGRTDFVHVLVDAKLHAELLRDRPFSAEVEEGGFLTGQVYQDQDRPGAYLVHVTGAPSARHSGASFLHFTFTGDSFGHVKQELDRGRQGERLLGWYHTHLFAASDDFGLSSIDFRLHFTTFRIPWQLAGLVNTTPAQRVLRFYVRRADSMALCFHQPLAGGPA